MAQIWRSTESTALFALHETLRHFLVPYPHEVQRAHGLMGVNNSTAVPAYNNGRFSDHHANSILEKVFELEI